MKKLVLLAALAAILATGTAFADHPDGFGIGLVGGFGWGGLGGGAGGLSLKIPGIPIFWAVNLGGSNEHFRIGLTGDYYMIDKALAPQAFLHWFLGLGGFVNLSIWSTKDWSRTDFDLGARVPIGLSFQPIKLLEIFLDVAPSFGLGITGSYEDKNKKYDSGFGFFWGLPLEIGLRLWF